MAGVQCDEAEIMQTVGVTGVNRDNASILPLSFGQHASLVRLNRSGEEFRDGWLHRAGHSKFSPFFSGHGLSAIRELNVSCYPTGMDGSTWLPARRSDQGTEQTLVKVAARSLTPKHEKLTC